MPSLTFVHEKNISILYYVNYTIRTQVLTSRLHVVEVAMVWHPLLPKPDFPVIDKIDYIVDKLFFSFFFLSRAGEQAWREVRDEVSSV